MTAPISRRAILAALATLPALAAPARLRARTLAEADLAPALEAAAALDQLHTLAVAHRGETALARAFRGPSPSQAVNVKSVSKTVVAALAGCAFARGLLAGPGQTLGEAAPGLIPPQADPRVAQITLGDLLSLRAGLARTSGPAYGAFVESGNWVSHVLTRPWEAEPGGRMLYSTGSTHVLGAVLAEAAGRDLHALAREWLGGPLDIAFPPWTRDPQGRYLGGNNMAMSPLEMLRFGEMARRGGAWEGTQVLPRDWIETSWIPRGRSPFSGDAYGYGWFLPRPRGHAAAYARGYGGQAIYVVPALELTVAITSDPTRPARSEGHFGALMSLIEDRILPAAERLA
ncbi:serine hydrolase [Albimonas sp. CAU 1670]|uniref:serine hydrolase domain-containing protein n=1 Tax=Albimonas sp. CAU 1670 TaxID=3032599 RepID=UPI0023D9EDC4|nr:serine hydrolase [Albimonas sp. CAU 1670]MDF2232287.1 serine hydrolase [Albimonas sp. CAU 1670]